MPLAILFPRSVRDISFNSLKNESDINILEGKRGQIMRRLKSSPIKPSEEVMMHLIYTCCIPILSYGCAVKEYSSRQMQDCVTATNDALRLIFGYNRWESIRTLRESFGFKSLIEIFEKTKRKFGVLLLTHHNPIISHIARNSVVENS